MPLSKERERQRWHQRQLQPKLDGLAVEQLQPNSNLSEPRYAPNHFGTVKSKHYADLFLGCTHE